VNFREAYQGALKQNDELDNASVEKSIKQRISPGGTGNLAIEKMRQRVARLTVE